MNKRTLHKRKRQVKGRKIERTISKRQTGGDNLKPVLLGMLDERYVLLPSTKCVNDKELIDTFLSSVTAFDLLRLIGDNDDFVNSNSISGLIEDIDAKSSDMFKNLGSLIKIPASQKLINNFQINCFKLTATNNVFTNIHRY
jgi:hypothetical protein